MAENIYDVELNELAEKFWNHVLRTIEAILNECDLHGLSGILDVKNPSIAERLKSLEQIEDTVNAICNKSEAGKEKTKAMGLLTESNIGITGLRLVLGAAKNIDNQSFNFAKEFLSAHISCVEAIQE